MMYFDVPARQRVVTMLEQRLVPNGYLFVSHSESLSGLSHGLSWCFGGVYQRTAA
jgi:chemotaxis protein methyltransferase CheR